MWAVSELLHVSQATVPRGLLFKKFAAMLQLLTLLFVSKVVCSIELPPSQPDVKYVFRGGNISSMSLGSSGGCYLLASADDNPATFSLFNHVERPSGFENGRQSLYVSTTTSPGLARDYAKARLEEHPEVQSSYIFGIRPTRDFPTFWLP